MFRKGFVAAAVGVAGLVAGVAPVSTASAATVKFDAELGQSVLDSKKSNRIFLKLSMKAIEAASKEKRTPVNVAIVIDRSGSMAGDRIAAAKEAAAVALERLAPDDTVSLVAYNHKIDVLHEAARLGKSYDSLKRAIDRLSADGTTALYAGVKEGGEQVKEYLSDTKVNRVILLSDGLANVGPSSPGELADLGRQLGSKGISVTTIGLGLDYNEDLMQRLAGASDGNHAFVEHPRQLAEIFDKEFGDTLSVSARDIIIHIECKAGFKPIRALGRDADISGQSISLKLNQLSSLAERYVLVEVEADKDVNLGEIDVATARIEYLDLVGGGRQSDEIGLRVRISNDEKEAEASINKSVMSKVTEQVATETSEKAVEMRDKGDVAGARKMLEDNAAYLNRQKSILGSGVAAAPSASIEQLDELEKKSREAAGSLDDEAWGKTRKSMRYDQHKSKVQQSY